MWWANPHEIYHEQMCEKDSTWYKASLENLIMRLQPERTAKTWNWRGLIVI